MNTFVILVLFASLILTLAAPQYPNQYVTMNPYGQPTFGDIYPFTTPYSIYGQNSMRIWPYVTGQYGQYGPYGQFGQYGQYGQYPYGQYYNNYNGYDNNNWYNWYSSMFPYRQYKK